MTIEACAICHVDHLEPNAPRCKAEPAQHLEEEYPGEPYALRFHRERDKALVEQGRREERARIVAFIRNIPGVEELPTVWTFCQDLASRIERDAQT
jgi:hypothetical protein